MRGSALLLLGVVMLAAARRVAQRRVELWSPDRERLLVLPAISGADRALVAEVGRLAREKA